MIRPYLYLGGALIAFAMLVGAYLIGRGDGKAIEVGKIAAAAEAVRKERAERQQVVDAGDTAGQVQETSRAASTKEIYREIQTVTERPVYRNVCVDADGVRLVERATAIANGEHPGASAGAAAEVQPAAPVG